MIFMKKFILVALVVPFAGFTAFKLIYPSTTNLLEVRPDPWPINLQRTIDRRDTSYALEFRDQPVLSGVLLDTLPFANLQQLRYLEQGLSALKKGHNGDIATYEDYSIKRTEVIKKDSVWYILQGAGGRTN